MKFSFKVFFTLLLASLYLFTGMSSLPDSNESFHFENSSTQNKSNIFSFKYFDLNAAEPTLKIANSTFGFSGDFYPAAGILNFLPENLFQARYNQYLIAYSNFHLNFSKSDLIFPFHYFW